MHASISWYSPASRSLRPLSRITTCSSSGPSTSPSPRGPVTTLVYDDRRCPVAERASSGSNRSACCQSAVRRSMPSTAMCTRGRAVTRRPLPSLVTSTIEALAGKPDQRDGRGAEIGGGADGVDEQVVDLVSVAVQSGGDDVARGLFGQLDDPLAEVGLDHRGARGLERAVELDLLGGHRLGLGDPRGAVALHDLDHVAAGGGGGRGPPPPGPPRPPPPPPRGPPPGPGGPGPPPPDRDGRPPTGPQAGNHPP